MRQWPKEDKDIFTGGRDISEERGSHRQSQVTFIEHLLSTKFKSQNSKYFNSFNS